MSMAGDERMESLIQEAYEQIPVYLRNGRDMNRKKEQAGGLEDYPVLERNQLIGNASYAGKIDLRKNIRIQWKVYGNFLDQGRLSQIHAAIVVLSL